jgi:hypothetical protein
MDDRFSAPRWRLAIALAALLLTAAGEVRAAPFRVCAFVFNSPDELAAIKSEVSPGDFEFVELTPVPVFGDGGAAAMPRPVSAAPAPPVHYPSTWLMDRCQPDLHCDVVVFSGEFAGAFFGNYGVTLGVQEVEEAACQARCQGLFHEPREVFLLACNTLATKSGDERTPADYLQVLLGHGFSRAAAQRVVEIRYGPLGPSFRESLRRSFMGVPRLYGFASVAPRGEITASLLHTYFQRKGDYARYLTRAERESTPNKELLTAFAGSSLVQTTGLTPLESAAADRALVCRVYDDRQTVAERLPIVRQLFARPDFLAFVPVIEVFFGRHPPETLRGGERRIFGEIQSLQAPRRQMLELMYGLNASALKMQMARLALQLEWITADDFRRLAVDGAKQLLATSAASPSTAPSNCWPSRCRQRSWTPRVSWSSTYLPVPGCTPKTFPRRSSGTRRGSACSIAWPSRIPASASACWPGSTASTKRPACGQRTPCHTGCRSTPPFWRCWRNA